MNTVPKEQHTGEGFLPGIAPLANPYVPFQMEHPIRYEAAKGLIRGTIYPGLDLPFKGMVNHNLLPRTFMSEMQAMAFAVQELALYLDTHADDLEALEQYHQYQKMLSKAKTAYEKRYGPIDHTGTECPEHYTWLRDPWPWEYAKNREA